MILGSPTTFLSDLQFAWVTKAFAVILPLFDPGAHDVRNTNQIRLDVDQGGS